MATVVIDAGHGGYDAGAVNGSRYEKDDNLRMALAVGQILEKCGVHVIYTRTTDVFIPLLERSAISNSTNADMFVSIHRNSSTNPAGNGVENWVYTRPSQTSVSAATNVLNRIVSAGVQNNRGLQYGNFSVLRETKAPAMLIELGFISNDEDNRLFDTNFNAYANAIAGGIMSSLGVTCTPQTPPPAPVPTPPTNAIIRSIQSTLNTNYGQGLTVDGIWGPMSARALIRAFQLELNRTYGAGLIADGVWGPKTKAAARNVRRGDRGNLVYLLQSALYVKGYPATPDGIFGAETENQVLAFQRANGLTADGIVGPNTWEKLFAK